MGSNCSIDQYWAVHSVHSVMGGAFGGGDGVGFWGGGSGLVGWLWRGRGEFNG